MQENDTVTSPYWALRITFGVVPFLAGLDKFLNLLTHWDKYLSPLAQRVLPVSATTFLHLAGIVEMAVGIAILARWTRVGSYVAAIWLVGIAMNLLLAGYFDVAVRDLVMVVGAYTLARLSELHTPAETHDIRSLRQANTA
jgi:uncharacterized membrane protein YphA (DoxX/SURF4 family)